MIWENVYTVLAVFAAYLLLAFALPAVCIGKYFKKKDWTFKYFLYQCVGNLYINFLLIFLGYLHLVNRISVIFFVAVLPLGATAWRERKGIREQFGRLFTILNEWAGGSYGTKVLIRRCKDYIKEKTEKPMRTLKDRKGEILIFSAVMIWAVWFYGWYKFHNAGYGHTDEETHLYWIGQLLHGNIFPAGMYPHGMHTLCGAIAEFLPLNMTRIYLNFAVISMFFIMTSACFLFRKLFSNRLIGLNAWALFVIWDVFHVTTYFRFQISFPMEFGLIAAFGMIYGMFACLKSGKKADWYLFGLSITWTLMAHFYITILCLAVCVCFGLVYFRQILKKKLLRGFITAGILSVVLAVIPYGAGLASGYSFERSIAWALGVMKDSDGAETEETQKDTEKEDPEGAEDQKMASREESPGGIKRTVKKLRSIPGILTYNYVRSKKTSAVLIGASILLILWGIGGCCFSKRKEQYLRYIFWGILWQAGAVMACSGYMGWTALIEAKRMATFLSFLTIPLLALPFEVIWKLLESFGVKESWRERVLGVSGTVCLMLVGFCGHLKDGRFYSISISEEDMRLCLDLCENREDYKWTVISPTNDLSVIRYEGYHYESIDLIRKLDENRKEIYIPTEEIYVVVEERAISFASDRRKIDRSDVNSDENVNPVSPESALQEIDFSLGQGDIHGADAPYYFQRDKVMSKLYFWMEEMKEVYPGHISIYSKNDQVTIYKITQDPYFLLNLSLDYKEAARERMAESQ